VRGVSEEGTPREWFVDDDGEKNDADLPFGRQADDFRETSAK
jgi:hypothetical protein